MSSHCTDCAHNVSQRDDPTKTLDIRQAFLRDIRGRFRRVNGAIRRTVGYENDAFGLSQNKIDAPEAYDFPTERQQINAFIRDLTEWIEDEILEPVGFAEKRNGEHWTAEYIRNAYLKGSNVAIGRLFQEGVNLENPDNQDLLNRPIATKTLERLYTRVYQNLKDITDDMADTMREEITKGFAQGENPKKIAQRLTREVKTLQRTRAETLARTEVINAHAESTFDTYERAGVEVVGHGEWQATPDNRTCPFCRRLSGENFRISEWRGEHTVLFRGQTYRLGFPAHPSGRCAPLPAVGFDEELEPLRERVPGTLIT